MYICPKHGTFSQRAGSHKRGYGCRKCTHDKYDEFIKKANEIHNNKYEYEVKYINYSNTKINIKCPKHGYFRIYCRSHLKGVGCKECAKEYKKSEDYKYDYSQIEYEKGKR